MSAHLDFDFVSIGGGAAGFFGAIAFAEAAPGARVAILEKGPSVLEKVRISGGGRCNVTHSCFQPRELISHYPRGEKNLMGPFHHWGPSETVAWFEERGVPLKTEEDGRMFPVSDRSQTIVNCLLHAAEDAGVEVHYQREVKSLARSDEGWVLSMGEGETMTSRAVLLATGGVRNGAGSRLAGELGHEMVPAAPSLFSFKIRDARLDGLSGVSVARVEAAVPGTSLRSSGPCLITHWGLSGPAILKLSAWGARELQECGYDFEVVVNWCAGEGTESVDALLLSAREAVPKKRVRGGLAAIPLPARLWRRLVDASGADEEVVWANLSKAYRRALAEQLAASRFSVTGKSTNKEEFVTAGGVSLREVDFKTMQSRRTPGLYFAGEVLDIDGVTGGFNFQSAWTSGKIAGEAAAEAFGIPTGCRPERGEENGDRKNAGESR